MVYLKLNAILGFYYLTLLFFPYFLMGLTGQECRSRLLQLGMIVFSADDEVDHILSAAGVILA